LKITHLDLRIVDLPYKEPVQWARSKETSGKYVLLQICTDDGLVGIAEGVDKPTWTGSEPLITCQLLRTIYEPLLVGLDPLRPDQVWATVNNIPGWSTAKVLLDLALTDLQAKSAGIPLWKHLGGWSETVELSWLLNLGDDNRRIDEAEEMAGRYGFAAFKVKIGRDAKADVDYVRKFRTTFGPSVLITLDANSLYTFQEAMSVAQRLQELDIYLFEDPCPMASAEMVEQVVRRCAIPVMVESQSTSPQQVAQFLDAGAQAVEMKVPRIGYRQADEIRRLCEARGAITGIGLMGESSIGSLFSMHLHSSRRHFQSLPAENCFFLKISEDLIAAPLEVVGGKVRLPTGPGIGAELNPEVIERSMKVD
jgi:L-alanine-DL-glutamate epimerase-like enolase superfamily enzyme